MKRRRKKGKMPAALRAYWAKRRGAGKRKRHGKRKRVRVRRGRTPAQPVIVLVG